MKILHANQVQNEIDLDNVLVPLDPKDGTNGRDYRIAQHSAEPFIEAFSLLSQLANSDSGILKSELFASGVGNKPPSFKVISEEVSVPPI